MLYIFLHQLFVLVISHRYKIRNLEHVMEIATKMFLSKEMAIKSVSEKRKNDAQAWQYVVCSRLCHDVSVIGVHAQGFGLRRVDDEQDNEECRRLPDKREATTLARKTIPGDVNVADLAASLEHPPQIFRRRSIR